MRNQPEVLHRLVEQGNSVIVIEHNVDAIKTADGMIDMGSEPKAFDEVKDAACAAAKLCPTAPRSIWRRMRGALGAGIWGRF